MLTMMRRALRRARSLPLIGAVIRMVDRAWWARSILRSGLVDAAFYAAQRGRNRVSPRTAVRHYIRRGWRDGLSLNPLFDETVAGRGLPESHRVPAMYAYVVSDNKGAVPVHPWWDAPGYAREHPDAETHPMGPLGDLWERGRDERAVLSAGSLEIDIAMSDLVEATLRFAQEWRREFPSAGDPAVDDEIVPLGIVRILQRGSRRYEDGLAAVAELTADGGTSVIAAVDVGAGEWLAARQLSLIAPRVAVRRFAEEATFAEVVNAAAAGLRSERLLVIEPTVIMSAPEARALAAAARPGTAAGPLSVQRSGAIDSLGAVLRGPERPYPFLHDHPVEDAAAFDERAVPVAALSGRTFAIDMTDFLGEGGLDTRLVNGLELEEFCVRAARRDSGFSAIAVPSVAAWQLDEPVAFVNGGEGNQSRFRAVAADAPASDLDAAFADVGFRVLRWDEDNAAPVLERRRGRPRWAIKICSPAGPAGRVWGDTHFAAGLAGALGRSGIDVVVDAFDARARSTSYLDDVTVVVRGPYRIDPPPHGVRILWIISHPDQITLDEVSRFDVVFAASERWAAQASARWGGRSVLCWSARTSTSSSHGTSAAGATSSSWAHPVGSHAPASSHPCRPASR